MRLLYYADPHWSVNSSIIRSRGLKYSKRLENLINSINWVENTARDQGCESIICLGDFLNLFISFDWNHTFFRPVLCFRFWFLPVSLLSTAL